MSDPRIVRGVSTSDKMTVGNVVLGPQTRAVIDVEQRARPGTPTPKWRQCGGCQAVFAIGAAKFMNDGRYVVKFCPCCGGSDVKEVPPGDELKRLLA